MDGTGLLPGTWVELFRGVDVIVMTMIGIVSYVLTRATRVNENLAMLVPLGLGAAWGILEATQAGYAPAAIIAKGVLMNGGGASIVGRLLHTTGVLDKLWPAPPLPPPP